ncbi:MAG: isoprenylcysteine carboxylmethyltransferase family protein [Pseudomonadota bacterium]
MGSWTDRDGLTIWQSLDIPPVWLLGFLIFTWVGVGWFPGLTIEHAVASGLGGLLLVAGLVLIAWAALSFRRAGTSIVPHQVPQRIITTGPFHFTRNPIYLGDALILSGFILWQGAWPLLVAIPLFVWLISRRFIAPEEARMKENFGSEFAAFAQKTRRWL